MKSVRRSFHEFGGGRFLARYPGGVTLRLARSVLICRWRGYVPGFVKGWRKRVAGIEIHVRRWK